VLVITVLRMTSKLAFSIGGCILNQFWSVFYLFQATIQALIYCQLNWLYDKLISGDIRTLMDGIETYKKLESSNLSYKFTYFILWLIN